MANPNEHPSSLERVMKVYEYGDSGLLIHSLAEHADDRWCFSQSLAASLLSTPIRGITDVIATYEDVFVSFNPLITTHVEIEQLALGKVLESTWSPGGRTHRVPVVYGGSFGVDLNSVAQEVGLEPDELISLHTSQAWIVRFRGATGGPQLDGPTFPRPIARCASPRTRVPAGSLALSGQQCAAYPYSTPGGWRLIGRTPLTIADVHDPGFVTYLPGDEFKFFAITEDEWTAWEGVPLSAVIGQANATEHESELHNGRH